MAELPTKPKDPLCGLHKTKQKRLTPWWLWWRAVEVARGRGGDEDEVEVMLATRWRWWSVVAAAAAAVGGGVEMRDEVMG
ncbi:hypothetical protein Tco_0886787 [Tanacetum coccineum]